VSHHPSILEQRIEWTRFRRQTDKDVLKALARWYCWRGDGTNIQPSNPELAARSQVPLRSVERALERLVDEGWLDVTDRQNRGRTTYRLCLERLATEDPDDMMLAVDNDPSTARVAVESGFDRQSGGRSESGGREIRPDFEKVAVEKPVVVDPCTSTGSSTTTEKEGTGTSERSTATMAVETILTWWIATYPLHNHGVPYILDRHDAATIGKLLQFVPLHTPAVQWIQDLSLALWKVESDHDPAGLSNRTWIARGDRSITVLFRKVNFLSRVVAGLEPQQLAFGPLEEVPLTAREIEEAKDIRRRVYGGCPHETRCAEYGDCVRAIARARKVG
jgi:hypothetical protein